MRKSNKARKNTRLCNFLSLITKLLPILMIVALAASMPSSLSSVAFASHGGYYHDHRSLFDMATRSTNDNQVGGENHGGLMGNLISQQQSPQAYARNINEDNKVIIVENCEDGEVIINDNDQIIQTNTQSFNKEANNEVSEDEEEEEEEEKDE